MVAVLPLLIVIDTGTPILCPLLFDTARSSIDHRIGRGCSRPRNRLDAQTVFLAGYSDNRAGSETVDLTQTDRAVFVKLSYAWLF